MYRSILKINLLSLLLLGTNIVLLGMKHAEEAAVVAYQKSTLFFPVEIMVRVAAEGDGEVKNNLRRTCGFFRKACTKDNIEFLSQPSFAAHRKDIEDMVCSAAWFNDIAKEQALARYNVTKINFTTTFKPNSLQPNSSTGLTVNAIKALRSKYNKSDKIALTDYELNWGLEPAFHCAIRCNDFEAINNIASQIKQYISPDIMPHTMDLQRCLLMPIIKKDQEELFRVVVNSDPVQALNMYSNQANDPSYQRPFLDVLTSADYIPQDLKDKYSRVYRECGGKTFDELEREKRENCIVS